MMTYSLLNEAPSSPSEQLTADWSWIPTATLGCLGYCQARNLLYLRFSLLWFLVWIRLVDIHLVLLNYIHLFSLLGSYRSNLPQPASSYKKMTGFQSLKYPNYHAYPWGWPAPLPAHWHQGGSILRFCVFLSASNQKNSSFSTISWLLWRSWNTSLGRDAPLLLSLGWYQAHRIHQLSKNLVFVSINPSAFS